MHHNESYGKYQCIANNEIGDPAEYSVYVERGRQPPKPETIILIGTGSDMLHFNLSTPELIPDDPMRISKYRFELMTKQDYEQNGNRWSNPIIITVRADNNVTYEVTPLKRGTTYVMQVASINSAGISEFSDRKEFTTLQETPVKGSNNSKMLEVPIYLLLLAMTLYY